MTTATGPADVATLYSTHRLALVRLAVLLVDDLASAEDVVQDAFIAFHRRVDQLRDADAALGYLRVCVVNGARSALRRRQVARRYSHVGLQPDEAGADTEALLADEHREVLRALRKLPDRQREVLTLRYWSDLSEAQIAEALGISRGAVKSNASRGMRRLGEILGVSA
ncbi:MAG TPA: SigE family RNA polymerase sigma factor [Jatrophihabitans sp.]|nr:SigE family RNA polymerase sigma factor [Jatrophihabitans sp.]